MLYKSNSIFAPNNVINELKNIVNKFIWNDKPNKIPYNTCIQVIGKGGLKLTDTENNIDPLKMTWVKRFANEHK